MLILAFFTFLIFFFFSTSILSPSSIPICYNICSASSAASLSCLFFSLSSFFCCSFRYNYLRCSLYLLLIDLLFFRDINNQILTLIFCNCQSSPNYKISINLLHIFASRAQSYTQQLLNTVSSEIPPTTFAISYIYFSDWGFTFLFKLRIILQ